MKTCQAESSARFLRAEMSDVEIAEFEDHLETCAVCRERLEHEAGGEEAWNSARKFLCHEHAPADGSDSARPASLPDTDSAYDRRLSGTSSLLLAILAPSD